jgi:hypothetical protein
MKPIDDWERAGNDPDSQWARVAADLRAYREAQRRAWGDLDDAAIARYLGDEATPEERNRVEQAMQDYPNVRECVEVLREFTAEEALRQEDHAALRDFRREPSRPNRQASSKWRPASLPSVRRLATYTLAACLLVAAGLTVVWWQLSHYGAAARFARVQSTEAEPQIIAMEVEQYRDDGAQAKPLGTIGVDSSWAREKDLVKVSAKLDRPAYCYVIAFNPDGHDQLYYPADRDVPPAKSSEIHYRADEGYLPLTNGAGLQVLVLVASNDPLPPYARWRVGLGELPWQPIQADGVWQSVGRGLLAMTDPTRSRSAEGAEPSGPPEAPRQLLQLYRFLATRPGVAAVRALAFPIKPDLAEDTRRKSDRG